MKKLRMHTPNLTDENISRIRELFPSCVTEAQGEDGRVKLIPLHTSPVLDRQS